MSRLVSFVDGAVRMVVSLFQSLRLNPVCVHFRCFCSHPLSVYVSGLFNVMGWGL